MLLDYHPSLRLQYDEDLALLRAEWVLGAAPAQQYQAALTCLLQAGRERGVRHCFLDMPDMPDISVYDQIWMSLHWVPGVVRLPLERVVFNIGSRKVYNQLAVESLIALARLQQAAFDLLLLDIEMPGMNGFELLEQLRAHPQLRAAGVNG